MMKSSLAGPVTRPWCHEGKNPVHRISSRFLSSYRLNVRAEEVLCGTSGIPCPDFVPFGAEDFSAFSMEISRCLLKQPAAFVSLGGDQLAASPSQNPQYTGREAFE